VAAALQRAHLVAEVLGARENSAKIVHGSNDGIAALAEGGTVVTWNPAMAALTGQPAEVMVGEHRIGLLDARDATGRPVPLEHWHYGGPLPDELSVLTRAGRRRWLSCSYARTERDGSSGPQLVLMVRDVTELRHQREMIAGQGRVLELVATDEPPARSLRAIAALVAGQVDGTATLVLPGLDPPLWVAADESDADPDGSLLASVQAVPLGRWIAAAGTGRPVLLEQPYWAMPVLDPDQSRLWCVVLVHPFHVLGHRPEPDEPALEVLRTAARLASVCLERDASRVRLAHQASHDPLTGLPNRLLFLDRCTHALAKAERSGGHAVVLFIDLDRFKVVNDSLGHDAGDRLLMAVAERLREAVRPSDTIARFGGDEFTILCEELVADEDARVIADRVLALFSTPFHLDGRDVFESASVGIALGTAPQRADELVQHADAAMYRAKGGGGNRYEFFDERLRKQAQARLASYTGLRQAVDACEFEVFYQPTVGLAHGNPVGVEALARWRHPTRGLLPPSAFIDLAEETGLIVPLGTQILRTALQEMPHAVPDGSDRPLRVAVNLSARQLTNPDLVPTVEQALADAGVPPSRLSLEITESMLLTDSAATREAIAQLKRIGVDLSLDDFGTGHCSMDYLKFLPVDELKIERRFVAGLLTDHQDRAIVSAIISLAHDLGLRVVAEGVETLGQATRLREMGCDVGQGYFFGAPMPGNDVLALTRRFIVPAPAPVQKPAAGELRAVRDRAG
jgi:diguanylate cyclase (GGDEF)-like protein/PAS domain S-box-containing protein